MTPERDSHQEETMVAGPTTAITMRGLLIGLAVCTVLIGLGVWQGDFGETHRNGTTL